MSNKKPKIAVILGPTASGKTSLGVKLAYKFNGEIVSADSRQVYVGMDVGTGKDLDEYQLTILNSQLPIKIPYHLIDVVKPTEEFDVAKYQMMAFEAIDGILERERLPILVGGTGLYLQAVVDSYILNAQMATNLERREELEGLDADVLFDKLQKLNRLIATNMNESDRRNKRRLVRLIEVCEQRVDVDREKKGDERYECLVLGLSWPKEVLNERIYKRLVDRLEKEDMVGEVERLHNEGVSWERLESFGLEYRFVARYLQEKMDYDEMVEKLNIASRQFAKRQMTWFRRWEKQGRVIHWVEGVEEAEGLIVKLLNG